MSDVQGKLCALLIACKSRIRETYVVKDEAERQLLNAMTESGERSIEYRGYQIKRVTPRPKRFGPGSSPSIRRMKRYTERIEDYNEPDYLEVRTI